MDNETWGMVDIRRFANVPLLASVSLALIANLYYLYNIFRTWLEEREGHSKPPVATSLAHEPDKTAGDHGCVLNEECVAAWNAACFGNFKSVAKYIAALHAIVLPIAFGVWCGAESETRASLIENGMLVTTAFTAIWLPVANGRVTVSRGIVLLCTSASHLLNLCDLIQTPPGEMTYLPHGQLRTALGLLLCDSRVNVPTQFVVSLVHMWNSWDKRRQINMLSETDWHDLACFCLGEFFVFSSAIFFGIVWEHALWIQTEDSDLKILSSSDKLSHLLMCNLASGSKVPIPGRNAKFRHLLGIKEDQFQRLCSTSASSADGVAETRDKLRQQANRDKLTDMTFSEQSGAAPANLSLGSFDFLPLGANFKSLMPGDARSASKSSASGRSSHSSAEGSCLPLEHIKFVVDSLSRDMSIKEVTFVFQANAHEELPKLKAWLLDESVTPFQLWLTDQVNAHCNNTEPVNPEVDRPVAMHLPGSGCNREALVAADATFLGPISAQKDTTKASLEEEEEEEEEEQQSEESEEEFWVQLELLDFSVQPIQLPRPPRPRASRSMPVLPTVQESEGRKTTKRLASRGLSAQVD
ncbi:unnamed protein product [Polarella glacialis]|uniref:Uncharacterized protein n=1 Tax=Polarella glacialis TaxID=89957 RepID=A0A813H007_POLGL|nr:unnamed protein product [Polarella glacialis]